MPTNTLFNFILNSYGLLINYLLLISLLLINTHYPKNETASINGLT